MNKGKWYSYNDSTVSAVGGYTGGGESYLLFYRRKSDNEEEEAEIVTETETETVSVAEGTPANVAAAQTPAQELCQGDSLGSLD